jgi:hypothetical protein
MKKLLIIGGVTALLSLLTVFWAIPALAKGPDDAESTPAEQETWEKMHETCEEGDWDAMTEAAEEVHGKDFNTMPCHEESSTSPDEEGQSPSHHGDMDNDMHGNMMGGHTGGGMMGGYTGNGGPMMR